MGKHINNIYSIHFSIKFNRCYFETEPHQASPISYSYLLSSSVDIGVRSDAGVVETEFSNLSSGVKPYKTLCYKPHSVNLIY